MELFNDRFIQQTRSNMNYYRVGYLRQKQAARDAYKLASQTNNRVDWAFWNAYMNQCKHYKRELTRYSGILHSIMRVRGLTSAEVPARVAKATIANS